jgi:O-acetyl-ADP-ribose deacetylase (regulator of RNase III)
MMKEVTGDLVKMAKAGQFDVVIHGANCFHTMGAGIAKTIKQTWPAVYKSDCTNTRYGDRKKLGTIDPVPVEGGLIVVNAYTQYDYRGRYNVDYDAITDAFIALKRQFGGRNLRFGIPKIGAGLAGGDWNLIATLIDDAMDGEDVTVVLFG